MPKQKQNNDPMAEELDTLRAEAKEVTKPEAQAMTVEGNAQGGADNSLVASLMATIASMQSQIANLQNVPAAKPKKDFGPPPKARKDRPHIMVFVKPDTCVRVEVPQSYIDAKKPGWDGHPVKGYAKHAATLRRRR